MIECPVCHVSNDDQARFCLECGQRFTPPTAKSAPANSYMDKNNPPKRPKLHSPMLQGDDMDDEDYQPAAYKEPPGKPQSKGKGGGLRSPLLGGDFDDEEDEVPPPRSPLKPMKGGAPKGKGGLRSPLLGGADDEADYEEDFPLRDKKGSQASHFPHRSRGRINDPEPDQPPSQPTGGRPHLRSPLLQGDDDYEEPRGKQRSQPIRGQKNQDNRFGAPPQPGGRPGKLHSPLFDAGVDEQNDDYYDDEEEYEEIDDPNVLRSPLLAARSKPQPHDEQRIPGQMRQPPQQQGAPYQQQGTPGQMAPQAFQPGQGQNPGQMPGPGQMRGPGSMPGQMPGQGQMPGPGPGQMPGPGSGQMPGPGQMQGPGPGQMPGPGPGPMPGPGPGECRVRVRGESGSGSGTNAGSGSRTMPGRVQDDAGSGSGTNAGSRTNARPGSSRCARVRRGLCLRCRILVRIRPRLKCKAQGRRRHCHRHQNVGQPQMQGQGQRPPQGGMPGQMPSPPGPDTGYGAAGTARGTGFGAAPNAPLEPGPIMDQLGQLPGMNLGTTPLPQQPAPAPAVKSKDNDEGWQPLAASKPITKQPSADEPFPDEPKLRSGSRSKVLSNIAAAEEEPPSKRKSHEVNTDVSRGLGRSGPIMILLVPAFCALVAKGWVIVTSLQFIQKNPVYMADQVSSTIVIIALVLFAATGIKR